MIAIRNTFSPEELPTLYSIECECFTKEFRWAESLFKRELSAALSKNNVWVIEVDGIIAGFLLAGDDHGRGHIETVNIRKAYRRQGLACRLISAAEREFKKRGYSEMKLEVHVDNPAQILYFNLGYRATQIRRHYYRLNSHAIRMSKKL